MLRIRPSKLSDLDALIDISKNVGDGMTSMPACRVKWQARLLNSERAFRGELAGTEACFFMVLEDCSNGEIAGTTAIYNDIGTSQPLYSFKHETVTRRSNSIKKDNTTQTLTVVEHFKGATEVGSLFLRPEYRRPGVGQMLARARYLLMANRPALFSDRVMAELRGWVDPSNQSPLWQALGAKFFDMPFQQAVTIAATKGPEFITELMPKQAIYIDLLPQSARDVIGKPNDSSAPALRMLEREGFSHSGYVDLFDGGPSVEAKLSEIATVKNSQLRPIKMIDSLESSTETFYLSNTDIENFKLTMASGKLGRDGCVYIEPATAELLELEASKQVRLVTINRSKKQSDASAHAA